MLRQSKKQIINDTGSFTLIELIIALVIIAIVCVISIPRVTTGIESGKFRKAVSEYVTYLRKTHLEAIVSRKDIEINFNLTENTLIRDDGGTFNLPPDVIFDQNDVSEGSKYTFFYNGRGTGPDIHLLGIDERKALVSVDLLSGLAKCDF